MLIMFYNEKIAEISFSSDIPVLIHIFVFILSSKNGLFFSCYKMMHELTMPSYTWLNDYFINFEIFLTEQIMELKNRN